MRDGTDVRLCSEASFLTVAHDHSYSLQVAVETGPLHDGSAPDREAFDQ